MAIFAYPIRYLETQNENHEKDPCPGPALNPVVFLQPRSHAV